jgi:hypothetical protein
VSDLDAGLLLSVDPGLNGCGLGLFREGLLEQGTYVEAHSRAQRSAGWLAMVGAVRDFIGARPVATLVVELPQVYIQARQKGDPNDLIQLSAVVGGLCVAFERSNQKIYLPAEWKGQVPKEIVHARAVQRLSEDERGRISCRKKALLHNAMDAVSIGLKFLGRL